MLALRLQISLVAQGQSALHHPVHRVHGRPREEDLPLGEAAFHPLLQLPHDGQVRTHPQHHDGRLLALRGVQQAVEQRLLAPRERLKVVQHQKRRRPFDTAKPQSVRNEAKVARKASAADAAEHLSRLQLPSDFLQRRSVVCENADELDAALCAAPDSSRSHARPPAAPSCSRHSPPRASRCSPAPKSGLPARSRLTLAATRYARPPRAPRISRCASSVASERDSQDSLAACERCLAETSWLSLKLVQLKNRSRMQSSCEGLQKFQGFEGLQGIQRKMAGKWVAKGVYRGTVLHILVLRDTADVADATPWPPQIKAFQGISEIQDNGGAKKQPDSGAPAAVFGGEAVRIIAVAGTATDAASTLLNPRRSEALVAPRPAVRFAVLRNSKQEPPRGKEYYEGFIRSPLRDSQAATTEPRFDLGDRPRGTGAAN
eukprot:scaffold183_cov249-Pinguiococcus_pyrenoidosus.AAC.3